MSERVARSVGMGLVVAAAVACVSLVFGLQRVWPGAVVGGLMATGLTLGRKP